MSDTVMLTTSITSSSVKGEEACAGAAQTCTAGSHGAGCSDPPAITETERAHAASVATTNLFMVDSPIQLVDSTGFRAQTDDYTKDVETFRTLLYRSDYTNAETLCRERLFQATDWLSSLEWTRELAIVERAKGRYEDSLNLQAAVHSLALLTTGRTRGKYENGLGRTYQLLRQYDLALDRYTAARIFHEQVGAKLLCASVDNNIGRTLTEAGRPEDSYRYFQRCERIAREFRDVRLLGEVLESRALALLAEKRIIEAARASLSSLEILSGTENLDAYEESERTHLAIVAALTKGEG